MAEKQFFADGRISFDAGGLRLSIDDKGRVVALTSLAQGVNYAHTTQESFLLGIREYGHDHVARPTVSNPVRMRVMAGDAKQASVALDYESGAVVMVDLRRCPEYLRMAVVEVRSQAGIAAVHWGPYATSMEGPIAEFLGLNRSDDFTMGLLGLNPNTDGVAAGGFAFAAERLSQSVGGSRILAVSTDRSRPVGADRNQQPMPTQAVPGQTVVGSAVALFGCEPAKERDVIEAIELGEGLPHPMLDGQWAKRSPRASDSSLWCNYTETNIDRWIAFAKTIGVNTLCQRYMFGNWGHFAIAARFDHGMDAMRTCSEKAAAAGIRTTIYTLSTFVSSRHNMPEPYINPVPDERLAHYLTSTTLLHALDETSTQVILSGDHEELLKVFPAGTMTEAGLVRIDDELIAYKSVQWDAGRFILDECTRGFINTRKATHAKGAKVVRMYFNAPYLSLFSGSEEMSREIASNIIQTARNAGLRHVVLDGLEETYLAGHDVYSENVFFRAVFDGLKDDATYMASTMQPYTWHMMTHISWGEGEQELGFRGSALDYRLWRLDQLKRNHMPRKIGQYYPDAKTTAEDIEWVMALAAGYDAGVDFEMGFPANQDSFEPMRRWEEARQKGAFSEKQKLQLRQTDCLFTLVAKPDGGWEPRLVRRWRSEHFEEIPSSAASVRALTGGMGRVAPCGIDFNWAHAPGIHQRVCMTDDLVHSGGLTASDFEIEVPPSMNPRQLLCVLRVPADAPGAIRNPRLVITFGDELERQYQLYFPTTLEPGQYLSLPHQFPVASVYDSNHQILKEVPMGEVPGLGKTKKIRVRITGEPVAPAWKSEFRVNMRLQEPFPKPDQG